jgi:hypothetical protein
MQQHISLPGCLNPASSHDAWQMYWSEKKMEAGMGLRSNRRRPSQPAALPWVAGPALLPGLDELLIVLPRYLRQYQGPAAQANTVHPCSMQMSCFMRYRDAKTKVAEWQKATCVPLHQLLHLQLPLELSHSKGAPVQNLPGRTSTNQWSTGRRLPITSRTRGFCCGHLGGWERAACLLADGVALHPVKVGDEGAAGVEELAPQQLAPAGHARTRVGVGAT